MVETLARLAAANAPALMRPQHLTLLVLTAVAVGSASAQVPSPIEIEGDTSTLCSMAKTADEAENDLAIHHQSVALNAALRSESAFWSLLVDPSTSYKERMAAALQGSSLISAQGLPRLWKAYAEFQVLPAGVNPSPCEFVWPNAFAARSPQAWLARKKQPIPGVVAAKPETRTILGFRVDLPDKAVDYPLDLQGRNHTPWLWQMQRALKALANRVQQYYSQADRYPRMAEVALRWQPANFYEKQIRAQNLALGPRNSFWVETLVRLDLQDGSDVGDLNVRGGDSYHFEELVHTAHIVILQQTRDKDVAAGAAFQVGQMARLKESPPFEFKPMRTSTSILAIARWAMNQELDGWTRYYSFAAEICRMLDERPFEPNLQLDPRSPEVAESLAKFEVWFARERPRLEQEAAKERPHLTDLAAELHQRVNFVMDGK